MGETLYHIYGPLFFGSVGHFSEKFDPSSDTDRVIVDFAEGRIVDMSAIDALNKLTERYSDLGKKIILRHLSEDSQTLLGNAKGVIEVNIEEDPTYKVMPSD